MTKTILGLVTFETLMTILTIENLNSWQSLFNIWQLIVTLDSIRNSCDILSQITSHKSSFPRNSPFPLMCWSARTVYRSVSSSQVSPCSSTVSLSSYLRIFPVFSCVFIISRGGCSIISGIRTRVQGAAALSTISDTHPAPRPNKPSFSRDRRH